MMDKPVIYFTGNSLGLQPKGAAAALKQELDDWARFGVEGHFQAKNARGTPITNSSAKASRGSLVRSPPKWWR